MESRVWVYLAEQKVIKLVKHCCTYAACTKPARSGFCLDWVWGRKKKEKEIDSVRYWESREHRVRHQADTSIRWCKNDYTASKLSSIAIFLFHFLPPSSSHHPSTTKLRIQSTWHHNMAFFISVPRHSETAPASFCPHHHRRSKEGQRLESMNAPSYRFFGHKLITNGLNLSGFFPKLRCQRDTDRGRWRLCSLTHSCRSFKYLMGFFSFSLNILKNK